MQVYNHNGPGAMGRTEPISMCSFPLVLLLEGDFGLQIISDCVKGKYGTGYAFCMVFNE